MTRTRSLIFALLAGVCTVSTAQEPAPEPASTLPAASSDHRLVTLGGDAAQPALSIDLTLDRSRITVADRLRLTLRLSTRSGIAYDWKPPEGVFGDFQVAERSEATAPGMDGPIRTVVLVLEPRNADGLKQIPAMEFRITGPKGPDAGLAARTPVLSVQVDSLLPDSERQEPAFAAAKGARSLAAPQTKPWPAWATVAIAIGCATGIGAALSVAAAARRRSRAPLDPVSTARRALADTRRELETLRNQPPAAAEDASADRIRAAGSAIARAIRAYLTDHLATPVVGAPAAEVPSLLRSSSTLPADSTEPVAAMLQRLESLTFSPTRPSVRAMLDELALAEDFVNQTSHLILSPPDRSGGAA